MGNNLSWGGAWSSDSSQLCCELYEAAAFASYAIGNTADTTQFAEAIIKHVAFEQSRFAQLMMLKSLERAGEHQQTITQGLALIRALKIDIPSHPTPLIVVDTLTQTEKLASQYSAEQIIDMQKSTVVDSTKRNILNLVEAGKYASGKRWGNVAEKILEHSTTNIRATLTLYGFLNLFFKPLDELADHVFRLHETAMKVGQIEGAMYAICQHWRTSFYGGKKLSTLSLSYDKSMELICKYCPDIVKFCVLDISLTFELMGNSDVDPYSYFDGIIKDETELLIDAKAKNNTQHLQYITLKRFFHAFYFGNYKEASDLSKKALSFPTSKTLKIQFIFHCFYGGLTSFRMHCDEGGESHLGEAKEMLEKMDIWHRNVPSTFENKFALIEAEYRASLGDKDAAIKKYEASIQAARDNGFVHEQGMAYEFMGHYLSSIVELQKANECYKQAHSCYMMWGAVAKAKQIQRDHNLDMRGVRDGDVVCNSLKHSRQ